MSNQLKKKKSRLNQWKWTINSHRNGSPNQSKQALRWDSDEPFVHVYRLSHCLPHRRGGVNHSRLGAPQLKFLTHIFAIFFHAMPCSPQSKTNSFWKLFRVLPTTKWNRADHILLYTRPPTTSLAVFLCLSWVSMCTAGPHSFSQTHTQD